MTASMASTLFALALIAQTSQPASRPADTRLLPGGTGADVKGKFTLALNIDNQALRVGEIWSVTNKSGKRIPKEVLNFKLDNNVRLFRLDEDVTGWEAAEDKGSFFSKAEMLTGTRVVSGAYFWDFSGDTAIMRRTFPVSHAESLLYIEDTGNLEFSSNLKFQTADRQLDGRRFKVLFFEPGAAGAPFEIAISGLPSHSSWPKWAALALSLAIFGWMIFSVAAPKFAQAGLGAQIGPLSASARRDQIVKAIEILDRDYKEEKIKEKRYKRRHGELMEELAAVLREIELSGTELSGAGAHASD